MQTIELLQSYLVDAHRWDEVYSDASVREQYKRVIEFLQQLSVEAFSKMEALVKKIFLAWAIRLPFTASVKA